MPVRRTLIPLFGLIIASTAPQGVAADWADPAKVLRIAFPIDVSGLDPAGTQETYATLVEQKIFDALLPSRRSELGERTRGSTMRFQP
jgi:hypothetical protein